MKLPLLALLLGTAALGHAQTLAPFVLKGKLNKIPGPAVVYLLREGVQQSVKSDSAVVTNGAFVLRGTLPAATRARLVLVQHGNKRRMRTRQADNATFFLEKGTTVFSSPDSLVHATITGSALTAQYQELMAQLKPSNTQMEALYAQFRGATPEQRAALEKQTDALEENQKSLFAAYVKAHPNTLVSLDAVEQLGGAVPNYTAVFPLFDQLTPAVKATPDGQAYAARLQALKRVAIGAQAPDFTLSTPEGKPVALSSLRGKYVLVDFWASWCGPCRRENPNVAAVYQAYKDRNFEILGVSIDVERNRAQWLKAIADDQLTWPQVSDLKQENEAARLYSVHAIPQNFLIDPSGKIVATNLRGDELKATVARFIPQP
ncbi:AhpC/TSA family protein [Hymenobacter sp. DH14]|uniref:AhpC/TSA family protein n=1 Tax=Hymenobacter cyanobacteriorum TaxID=2926463 RepID=A0A9X2AGF4_9BACT|nr:TlpA disulfide reductase family protein [Hymenobacter cyanobacteriorum]MCI1186250.1 AhpC/TSA family protein [Hymenobacter cyanobacteriorum]